MNLNFFPKLDISIVIGSNEDLIIPCISSIYQNNKILANIYVVSNLSSPSIVDKIKRHFPKVNLIINDKKKSFAKNHNDIIKRSKNKYILILNDDTFIKDRALDKMIEFMNNTPNAGCVSPKLLNSDGSLQPITYSFPTLFTMFLSFLSLRDFIPFNNFTRWIANKIFKRKGSSRFWSHDEICKVDTFKGACNMVRRIAIEKVGLMDEVSKFCGEENEWHYRFKKKGWNVYFFPNAHVIHYGSQTIGSKDYHTAIIIERSKAALNIFKKHHTKLQFVSLRILLIMVFLSRILIEYFKMMLGSSNSRKKIVAFKQALKIVIKLDFIHKKN